MDKSSLFLLSYAVIALGYFLRRIGIIREEDAGGIVRVILNVTLPAVVLKSFLAFKFDANYLFLSLIVILYSTVMFFTGLALTRGRTGAKETLFRISLLGFNIGLFAYPLIESLWGSHALGLAVFFDLGNALVIFGLAYVICIVNHGRETGSHVDSGRMEIAGNIARRLFTFIPFLSFIVAVALSAMEVRPAPMVNSIISSIAGANSPLVFLLLGITFTLDISRKELGFIAKVLSIRYAFGALAGLGCFYLLPFDSITRVVILVCLMLPAGMAIIPYSIEFGYNRNIANAIVNISNIISFGILMLAAGIIG